MGLIECYLVGSFRGGHCRASTGARGPQLRLKEGRKPGLGHRGTPHPHLGTVNWHPRPGSACFRSRQGEGTEGAGGSGFA